MIHDFSRISTAVGRWSGLGPYYAMFPREFAFEVIKKYSEVGQSVLDPFAGRATSIHAADVLKRYGCGIEINPVGWIYGKAKLNPTSRENILRRNNEIGSLSCDISKDDLNSLPTFFLHCYTEKVLRYLLAARKELKWKRSLIDATLMAIILVHLHGKRESSLSNQMRQSKAMHPDYSIRWWQERNMLPPDIDPVDFITKRIEWRYAKGLPNRNGSTVILGDSISKLKDIHCEVKRGQRRPFDLLFTSPPYYKITNYHYDQWLRLWMLNGSSKPTWTGEKWKGKFESKVDYQALLHGVFSSCSRVMSKNSTIYVRTDAREFTFETTKNILSSVFPEKSIDIIPQPLKKKTQTSLYGDKTMKPGEIDLVMRP